MRSLGGVSETLLSALVAAVLVGVGPSPWAATDADPEPMVTKALVIIKSTSSFPEAKSLAIQAAERLAVPLDLRDLAEAEKIGLTFPKASCEEQGFPYPCYLARGRYDDGVYVSIEYSTAYSGFRKGLYIVVLASGTLDAVQAPLTQARRLFSDAYAKTTKVYMGCMH